MRVSSTTAGQEADDLLPTVAALDRLWAEVARRPLYAPPNFWRYLRLRWRMRLTLVDPARVGCCAPAGKVNDCAGCNELCCVGPHSAVLLRLRDIATLVDVGRTDLIAAEKPSFSAEQLARRPALGRHVRSRAWQIFPVLAQNRYGACRALTAEGRCSLYPHWPLSCARFPYALHLDDMEVFFSERCRSFWIHPRGGRPVEQMAAAAVAGYNERIKDMVLLCYARARLHDLGVARFLSLPGDRATA